MTDRAAELAVLEPLRLEYRAWLEAHVPGGWRERVAGDRAGAVALARWWMRELHAGGYAAPGWPKEHGGMGATLAEQIVLFDENARTDAPSTSIFSVALNHTGATLILHGTDQQRQHLARIVDGEEIWCQGFSEPNAGSDLASLQTRAVRDGDHYIINGQKVWSSLAAHADWCLLLARTDPDAPKRKGIGYFLLDLRSPGVEVRPLRQITGTAEFCEIFLDDVAVPETNRVGAENDGWRISQTTLLTERGPFFLPNVQTLRTQMTAAIEALCQAGAAAHAAVRQQIARDYTEVEILAELYAKVLASQLKVGEAGPQSSIVKLYYSEVLNRLTGDVVDSLGLPTQLGTPRQPDDERGGTWMLDHLGSWGMLIGGGTNEIQRNLIGERVLGLPREPQGS